MFIRALLTCSLLTMLWQASGAPASSDGGRVGLTVPAAPWTLTLPGDGLVVESRQVKPDGRYGYFLLSDKKNRLMISAFIEPAVKCRSSRECRDMVWKAGNPTWENPQNVVLSEFGGVSYFEFLMPTSKGVPVRQQHLYAQFVVDGYWGRPPHLEAPLRAARARAVRAARQVRQVRAEEGGAPGQTPEEAARRVAEAWLPLLDSGRYAESWGPLSAKTKNDWSQRNWELVMTGVRRPLGELKSRRFERVVHAESLQGYPGNEGAIARFDSVFENRAAPVIELVGVIHDDDGVWRVLLYDVPD